MEVSVITYEIASGCVLGRDHHVKLINGHDAVAFRRHSFGFTAIVCDGCGSAPHSEVGSKIGAQLVLRYIEEYINTLDVTSPEFWDLLRVRVTNEIQDIAYSMAGYGGRVCEVLSSYFLFTIVGCVQYLDDFVTFSIGDGVIIINDEVMPLGPFPGNAPPYLSYFLPEFPQSRFSREDLEFKIKTYKSEDVNSFLVGTDGAKDLIEREDSLVPGNVHGHKAGNVSKFWKEDVYFTNEAKLSRQLNLLNGGTVRISSDGNLWRHLGLLPDDVAIVVGRKKKEISKSADVTGGPEDKERGEPLG